MAAKPTKHCERCGAPAIEIGLLTSSARLVMRSCSRCDHRTWSKQGEPAELGAVLQSVGSSGKRRSA